MCKFNTPIVLIIMMKPYRGERQWWPSAAVQECQCSPLPVQLSRHSAESSIPLHEKVYRVGWMDFQLYMEVEAHK